MRLQAALHVVGQHAGRPGREQVLAGEVLVGRLHIRPHIAAADGEFGRRHAIGAAAQFDQAPGQRPPPRHHRRVEHHDAAHQVRPRMRHHQAKHAAQRMADQDHWLVVAGGEFVDVFIDQVRPAVADRIARAVAVHVQRLDIEIVGQQLEVLAVHAAPGSCWRGQNAAWACSQAVSV